MPDTDHYYLSYEIIINNTSIEDLYYNEKSINQFSNPDSYYTMYPKCRSVEINSNIAKHQNRDGVEWVYCGFCGYHEGFRCDNCYYKYGSANPVTETALYQADVLRFDPMNKEGWSCCTNSLGKHDRYWGCAL